MNLDPESLFALIDTRPPLPEAATQPAPAAPTLDAAPTPIRSESIVGDHFWAYSSVLIDLS